MHGHDNPCYISGILTNPFVKDKRFLVLEVQRGHGINDVMAVIAIGKIHKIRIALRQENK